MDNIKEILENINETNDILENIKINKIIKTVDTNEPVNTKEPVNTNEPVNTKELVNTNEPVNTKEPVNTNEQTIDDNLSNNKVQTEIEPNTTGNYVNVSLCSCTVVTSCIIS